MGFKMQQQQQSEQQEKVCRDKVKSAYIDLHIRAHI